MEAMLLSLLDIMPLPFRVAATYLMGVAQFVAHHAFAI